MARPRVVSDLLGHDGPRTQGRVAADAGGVHRRRLSAALQLTVGVVPVGQTVARWLPVQPRKMGRLGRKGLHFNSTNSAYPNLDVTSRSNQLLINGFYVKSPIPKIFNLKHTLHAQFQVGDFNERIQLSNFKEQCQLSNFS